MSDRVIGHNNHPPICPKAWLTGESVLIHDQIEFIQQIYSHNVIPSTISDNMSNIIGKEFNSITISNLEKKDWWSIWNCSKNDTSTENYWKTKSVGNFYVQILHSKIFCLMCYKLSLVNFCKFNVLEWEYHMYVSYTKKTMDSACREKGGPSNESKICFKVFAKILEDVANLRNKMKIKNITKIVLIKSFASDSMLRVVCMFSDVFYIMNITCSINQQNKPFFSMVVKDASGQTILETLLFYCLEKWLFNKIIKTVFI